MWNVATTSRDYQKYLTLSNIISRKQTFLTIKQRYQIHTQLYCYCCSLSLGQVCFLFFESLACFDFLNKCNSKALQVCFLFPKYIFYFWFNYNFLIPDQKLERGLKATFETMTLKNNVFWHLSKKYLNV